MIAIRYVLIVKHWNNRMLRLVIARYSTLKRALASWRHGYVVTGSVCMMIQRLWLLWPVVMLVIHECNGPGCILSGSSLFGHAVIPAKYLGMAVGRFTHHLGLTTRSAAPSLLLSYIASPTSEKCALLCSTHLYCVCHAPHSASRCPFTMGIRVG
ncbi:hypothetical protein BC826DRAFT_1038788 [Russula brevipes]|nr:hypothetical protein BC826DRAFT_1038788 [Russula brevipes]